MEDRIYIIVAKVLQGEASDAERLELDAWLAADAGNKEAFREMQQAWADTDFLLDTSRFDTDAAWQKVASRTINAPGKEENTVRRRTIALPTWARYSAAVAAILLVTLLVWNPFAPDNIQLAAKDSDQRVELPDGSVIFLRKGSHFSYPRKFAASERLVKLDGEAYFEVARNEAQPFVIDANSVDVKVLGTTFNVRYRDAIAEVAVTSGKVQVTAHDDAGKQVILTPGEKAHYENGQLSEGSASGYESLWKTAELNFNNEPFSRVIAAITAVKDTVVNIGPGVDSTRPINARFKEQSLEDMLTELCLITNCRWEKQSGVYLVRSK